MRDRSTTKSPKTARVLAGAAHPVWNADIRELSFGKHVVKRYHTPAACQELVLTAFQEEGWPARIDDPLPPGSNGNPKRRLHGVINCLNRAHRIRAIRFHGDGTGTAVLWKPL